MRIAFSGIKGAYAETAAKLTFPGEEIISYSSFSRAYKAVSEGNCEFGILPIENSYAGDVSQVLDLLYFGNLGIVRVVEMPINHYLLGAEGTDIRKLKKVYSHPQALEQCKNYIEKAGYEIEAMSNTAVAARTVATENDITIAAIAGKETAELYGLTILDSDIGDSPDNTTRFAVITKVSVESNLCLRDKYPHNYTYLAPSDQVPTRSYENRLAGLGSSGSYQEMSLSGSCSLSHLRSDACHEFSLVFTVKDEAGALAKAVTAIGERGFNMKSIRSRPSKKISWSYYFYVEGEGDMGVEEGRLLLKDLDECCENVRIIGNYECETIKR